MLKWILLLFSRMPLSSGCVPSSSNESGQNQVENKCATCERSILPLICPLFDDCNQCTTTNLEKILQNGCFRIIVHCPESESLPYVFLLLANGTELLRPLANLGLISCDLEGSWNYYFNDQSSALLQDLSCVHMPSDIQESPIDMTYSEVEFNATLTTLQINYFPNDGDHLTWSEHEDGFHIATAPPNDRSTFYATQTDGVVYRLYQMHMHWGDNITEKGSEHLILGQKFAGELHFVHFDFELYGTFEAAVGQPDGLAVTAVFVEIGAENVEFNKIVNQIRSIGPVGDVHGVGFDYNQVMPGDRRFFVYTGSLTTPQYSTCVEWTVFYQPITMSQEQFSVLYTILVNNFREPQIMLAKVHSNFLFQPPSIRRSPIRNQTRSILPEIGNSTEFSPDNLTNTVLKPKDTNNTVLLGPSDNDSMPLKPVDVRKLLKQKDLTSPALGKPDDVPLNPRDLGSTVLLNPEDDSSTVLEKSPSLSSAFFSTQSATGKMLPEEDIKSTVPGRKSTSPTDVPSTSTEENRDNFNHALLETDGDDLSNVSWTDIEEENMPSLFEDAEPNLNTVTQPNEDFPDKASSKSMKNSRENLEDEDLLERNHNYRTDFLSRRYY